VISFAAIWYFESSFVQQQHNIGGFVFLLAGCSFVLHGVFSRGATLAKNDPTIPTRRRPLLRPVVASAFRFLLCLLTFTYALRHYLPLASKIPTHYLAARREYLVSWFLFKSFLSHPNFQVEDLRNVSARARRLFLQRLQRFRVPSLC